MKNEIEKLEELTGDIDYLLQEGVYIQKSEKERLLFLLERCTELVEEMNEITETGAHITGLEKAAKRICEKEMPELKNVSQEEFSKAYKTFNQ